MVKAGAAWLSRNVIADAPHGCGAWARAAGPVGDQRGLKGMALRWRLAVITLAVCFLCLLHAEVCSAAGFYASMGYRPALQNIGRLAMSMDGRTADVFAPGLDTCCGPLEAREVDSRMIVRSARAASVTYSSDYTGVFGGVLLTAALGWNLRLRGAFLVLYAPGVTPSLTIRMYY